MSRAEIDASESIAQCTGLRYKRSVHELNALRTRLLAALEAHAAANPQTWQFVPKSAIAEMAETSLALMGEILGDANNPVVDPISGLTLPPRPENFYKDRLAKYGKKITIADFIEREVWGRYRDAGLLYSEFIRRGDRSLYDAITSKAQYNNMRPAKLMVKLGILTKSEIDNPPPKLVRQARLIKAAKLSNAMEIWDDQEIDR